MYEADDAMCEDVKLYQEAYQAVGFQLSKSPKHDSAVPPKTNDNWEDDYVEHVAPPGGWSPTPALDDEEETSGRKKGPAVMEQDGGSWSDGEEGKKNSLDLLHNRATSKRAVQRQALLEVMECRADGSRVFLNMRMREVMQRILEATQRPPEENDSDGSSDGAVVRKKRAQLRRKGGWSKTPREREVSSRRTHHTLHARDLRAIDTSYAHNSAHPAIIVRRDVIVANFSPLRVVIVWDRLLVLVPPQHRELCDQICEALREVSSGRAESRRDSDEALHARSDSVDQRKPPLSREPSLGAHITDLANGERPGSGAESEGETRFAAEYSEKGELVELVDGARAWRTSAGRMKSSTSKGLMKSLKGTRPHGKHGHSSSGGESSQQRHERQEHSDVEHSREKFDADSEAFEDADDMPFELRALEATLVVATRRLTADLECLLPASARAMAFLQSNRMRLEPLEKLRHIKNAVSEQETRARDTADAITATLDEDEDMCMMRLSLMREHPALFQPPISPELLTQHEDVELLLESYLQGAEAVQTRLELLRLSIDNAEDLFTMKLDIARNRLITADTIFTLLSMIVASGALVAGFFGMNLTQGQASFITVVASTLVICVLLSVFIFITLIRSNTLVF